MALPHRGVYSMLIQTKASGDLPSLGMETSGGQGGGNAALTSLVRAEPRLSVTSSHPPGRGIRGRSPARLTRAFVRPADRRYGAAPLTDLKCCVAKNRSRTNVRRARLCAAAMWPCRTVCFLGRFLPKLGGATKRRHFFCAAGQPGCSARNPLPPGLAGAFMNLRYKS